MQDRARILIVDGDKSTYSLLESAFPPEEDSFELQSARSRAGVLFQHALAQPDVILLCVSAARTETWETLSRLREHSSVPIIALSSIDDSEVTIRSLQLGADYCLSTAVSPMELQARVRALLRRKRAASGLLSARQHATA